VDDLTIWVDPSSEEDNNLNLSVEEPIDRPEIDNDESSLNEEPYILNFEGNPIETGPYPPDLFRLMTVLSTSQQEDADLATVIGRLTDETGGGTDLQTFSYDENDKVLKKKETGRLIMVIPQTLVPKVISLFHDLPFFGAHRGTQGTLHTRKNYKA
jgi:hypothetical protein